MALLTHRSPVHYGEQQGAFLHVLHRPKQELTCAAAALEDFLRNYKSSSTEAADALEGLQIDGDDEDYDFMDESDDTGPQRPRRSRDPKHKYMQLLQDVADRKANQVLIELDDLDQVRLPVILHATAADFGHPVRKELGRGQPGPAPRRVGGEERAPLHRHLLKSSGQGYA